MVRHLLHHFYLCLCSCQQTVFYKQKKENYISNFLSLICYNKWFLFSPSSTSLQVKSGCIATRKALTNQWDRCTTAEYSSSRTMCHHKNATRKKSGTNTGNYNVCISCMLAAIFPLVRMHKYSREKAIYIRSNFYFSLVILAMNAFSLQCVVQNERIPLPHGC